MISALGHCEDPQCSQLSSNHELVRLFRCTIHCDRRLCLFHLNAHDVYYEEEKKQNTVVLTELQNNLTLYQSIFEQHLVVYRELVHQASSLLLQNTSALVPIEQIRPILEKLQKAIAVFQQEKVIIKSESSLDVTEFDIEKLDSNFSKDFPSIKRETNTPVKIRPVLRLERVDFHKEIRADYRLHDEQMNRNQNQHESIHKILEENLSRSKDLANDLTIDSISSIGDDDTSQTLRSRKSTEENHQIRTSSPACPGKKKHERTRKKSERTVPLKRLQT